MKKDNSIKVQKISNSDTISPDLVDQIIEFDKANMEKVFTETEFTFPEEKRRKGCESGTFTIIWKNNKILGYLQYCRSWDNNDDIYISSLQISPEHRNKNFLLLLLYFTKEELEKESFSRIVAGVQKNNHNAIRLYKKMGFSFSENKSNEKSFAISTTRELFLNNIVISDILGKWYRKYIETKRVNIELVP